MNLRRFVTYVYRYDQGKRGKNAGFIKADIRDDGCRMEIQVRGADRFTGRAPVHLIVRREEPLAVTAGEMPMGVQGGRMKLFFARNFLGDSGYTVDDILAVAIRCGNTLLVSCWSEQVPEAVLRGEFRSYESAREETPAPPLPAQETAQPPLMPEPETETPAPEPQEQPTPEEEQAPILPPQEAAQPPLMPVPETEMPAPETEMPAPKTEAPSTEPQEQPTSGEEQAPILPPQETTTPLPEISVPKPEEISSPPVAVCDHDGGSHAASEMLRATDVTNAELPPPKATFQRIDITDIRSLPKSNWHLCSNSFLIHGFFNYRYLILKTVPEGEKTSRYLGVPGIYEQPERMMAAMFGFPEFEPASTEDISDIHSPAGTAADVQGYWLCRLD